METIKPGKYVELTYKLYEVAEPQEILMYSFTEEQPDNFVFGLDNGMLESFKKAISGLKTGETFDITLSPEEAFGPIMEDYIMEFEKAMFEVDGNFDDERIKEGETIEMMTADGHRVPAEVVEVGEKVKLDFNHPFAGQSIHFVGEVKTIRDATPEELQPKGCCSCGHDHDHECGDGECGGCSGCN
ncbi:MAG: FKBP-type peptidyl-prolyl cis-trans isomerase [Muribaculaceae bacterium]|nr:FKBP-type peptidyl-prolyl cis-trans isomerase [Muribaculaceae bacterium]